jgi:Tfp pilus tip-associated adhesin PilY1
VPYSRGDTAAGPRGWYLDLPQERERVLQSPVYFEGQQAVITSTVPADVNTTESCEAAPLEDRHWLTVINMISGRPSVSPVFALPGVTGGARRANRVGAKSSEFITLPGAGNRIDLISVRNGPGCTERGCTDKASLLGASSSGARMDWREVLR